VSFANAAGGHDNITAVVVEIRADDPEIEIVDEMSVDIQLRFEALGGVFLFDGLSLALLARVLNHCEINEYKRGDVVITEGDSFEQLMVVVHGRFSVLQRDKEVSVLETGDHLGETTVLSPRRARATVRASELSRMLVLKREPFWKLVRSRPWLGVGLLERLGRRLSLDLDRTIEQREDGETPSNPPAPYELV
jgi:CRP-like cAMP-binding protein